MNRIFIVVLSFFLTISTFAQKEPALFTVNKQSVPTSEFVRVYEKNLSLVTDPEQRNIDNYLNLYVNYKLKLQDAYRLKMDTVSAYQREFAKYQNQLLQPYLKDENLELDLLREAYERSKIDINASHILIKIDKKEQEEDTLTAYNKITAIRNRIVNGENFETLAKEFSADPSAAKNGGNLGYFSVFQMVYPFENMAYQTKIGEVSQPFRTQFGYHILKVNDTRPTNGEVEVAHIMLRGDTEANRTLIENIKTQLSQGADFAELAGNYSQDAGSNKKGGLLPKFGTGRMIPAFEKVAFSLQNAGDISAPFQTEFGWHIIKMIKRYPLGTFDEVKTVLKQKVDQGQRAQLMGNSVVKRLLNEYKITENKDLLARFAAENWKENPDLQGNQTLLNIDDQHAYSVAEFNKYLSTNQKEGLNKTFQKFKEEKIIDVYKQNLPNKFPELKETLQEYREGLLLFDLMQKKIWERAEKDSIGLKEFFDKNQSKYRWKERATIVTATLKDQNTSKLTQLLQAGVHNDSIFQQLKDTNLVDIREDMVETESELFPSTLQKSAGSQTISPVGNQFKLQYIKEVKLPENQKLNEVKGKVMSDYQEQIEKDWISGLRKEFTVKVNKKELKKLKAKYQQH